jgi:hypothetical protein
MMLAIRNRLSALRSGLAVVLLSMMVGCWQTPDEVIREQDATVLPNDRRVVSLDQDYKVGEMQAGKWYPFTGGDGKRGRFRIMLLVGDFYAFMAKEEGRDDYSMGTIQIQPNWTSKELDLDYKLIAEKSKPFGVTFDLGIMKGDPANQLAFVKSLASVYKDRVLKEAPKDYVPENRPGFD